MCRPRSGPEGPDAEPEEPERHCQEKPAVGQFAQKGIGIHHRLPPYRFATGVKVEKSTIVPRTCM